VANPIFEPLILILLVDILPIALGQASQFLRCERFDRFGSVILMFSTSAALLFSLCDVLQEKEVVVSVDEVFITLILSKYLIFKECQFWWIREELIQNDTSRSGLDLYWQCGME